MFYHLYKRCFITMKDVLSSIKDVLSSIKDVLLSSIKDVLSSIKDVLSSIKDISENHALLFVFRNNMGAKLKVAPKDTRTLLHCANT